jgi:hypothetical protein
VVVTASPVHDPFSGGGNVGSKAFVGKDMKGLADAVWMPVDKLPVSVLGEPCFLACTYICSSIVVDVVCLFLAVAISVTERATQATYLPQPPYPFFATICFACVSPPPQ